MMLMPVIPALSSVRQHVFQASLSYLVRPYFKNQKQKKEVVDMFIGSHG
jgi:hypothetical protein